LRAAIYLDDERGGRLLWIVADVLALDGPFVDDFPRVGRQGIRLAR
jgi:hypothetical protein